MNVFFIQTRKNSFENTIWLMACGIATLRAIVGLVDDYVVPNTATIVWLVDISLLIGFAGAGFGLYTRRISKVPIAVSLVLICLLALNFIQFGGVHGQSEFNLLGMVVFLILAHNKNQLVYLLPVYFMVCGMVVVDSEVNGPLTQSFFVNLGTGIDDFWYTTVALLILVLYFKSKMLADANRLLELKEERLEKIELARKQTELLKDQMVQLNSTNSQLRTEFSEITKDLSTHDDSIKKFIKVANETLDEPVRNLIKEINELESTDFITLKLKETGIEMEELRSSLKLTQ